MERMLLLRRMRNLTLGMLRLLTPLAAASGQEKVVAPAGGAVNITVTAGTAPPPPVSITSSIATATSLPSRASVPTQAAASSTWRCRRPTRSSSP